MSIEKPTILVADSRLILKTFIRILGDDYTVIEVSDGEEAWEQLQENPDINALFCDTKLPHLSGLELLQKLRCNVQPHLQQLPVIMLTGDSDNEAIREQALGYGASDFITKPFDSAELKARAKAHVKVRSADGAEQVNIGTIDPVTQLGNKPFFLTRGEQMASFANRHHSAISLLLIRVDGFEAIVKQYRDSPKVVENLLVTVGSFIASGMRKEDTVARLNNSLDECLDIIKNARDTVVGPEHLINQMLPLLAYCDKRLGIRLSENIMHLIKR